MQHYYVTSVSDASESAIDIFHHEKSINVVKESFLFCYYCVLFDDTKLYLFIIQTNYLHFHCAIMHIWPNDFRSRKKREQKEQQHNVKWRYSLLNLNFFLPNTTYLLNTHTHCKYSSILKKLKMMKFQFSSVFPSSLFFILFILLSAREQRTLYLI